MTTCSASLSAAHLQVRAPSDRTLIAMLIALCLFSAALGRFCFLLRPFDNDAAIFIYMGKMVSQGGRLCHDLIDNKFPTVGLMTSIIYKALGTCWPAYVALQAIASLATAVTLARVAGRTVGSHARLPTMLFAIVFLNFTTVVFGGFQLETMLVLFTALTAAAGIEWLRGRNPADAFVAGLCAGCGAMFKPTSIGVLAALFIAAMIRRQKILPGFGAVLAGLSIPLGGALLYLWQAHLLADMPALYRQISTYAHESVFDITELIKPATAMILLGFPVLIRGFVFRRQRDFEATWPALPILTFAGIWLTIETAGIVLQGRMYAYHFMPMIPPAALLFGMMPRFNRPASLAAAIVPIALLSMTQAGKFLATNAPGDAPHPVSQYLIQHARPGDKIWSDGWPRFALETNLSPGARLPFTFLFTNYDSAGLDYSAGLIADFERTKPAYIILPTPLHERVQRQIDFIPELSLCPIRGKNYGVGWDRIEQYTLQHYIRETMIGSDAVYHRRER